MDWIEIHWFRWRLSIEFKHNRSERPIIPFVTAYIESNKLINNHNGVNIAVLFECYWVKLIISYNEGLPVLNCTKVCIYTR